MESDKMSTDTREIMRKSLIEFLRKKPFDKITVKSIVKDCNLNRNTFYYHYKDIYDLLEEIISLELKKITNFDADNDEEWEEKAIRVAETLKENRAVIYNVYNPIDKAYLGSYLFNVLEEIIGEYIRKQSKGYVISQEDFELITRFFSHGLLGMMLEWFEHGLGEDPDCNIRRLGMLLNGSIKNVLEKAKYLERARMAAELTDF